MATHTLKFETRPSSNNLRLAAEAVLTRPFPVTGYKYVKSSELEYEIEEVDILAELRDKTTAPENTHICPVTLHCEHCGRTYKGWQALPKKWYDPGPYHFATKHCPACPPVDPQLWLAAVGILSVKPEYSSETNRDRKKMEKPPAPVNITIALEDFI